MFFLCRCVWGAYCSWMFFKDSMVELQNPRPNGFPAAAIYVYLTANMLLNCLNLFWFSKVRLSCAGYYLSTSCFTRGRFGAGSSGS